MRLLLGLMVLALFSGLVRSADNLPHGFTKHGEAWTIRYVKVVDNDATNNAVTFCGLRLVEVRRDIKGHDLAKSLMHEVMHALACDGALAHDQRWNNSGDKDDGYEGHEGIYWGSEELLAFIQENPEFIAFIQQSGK